MHEHRHLPAPLISPHLKRSPDLDQSPPRLGPRLATSPPQQLASIDPAAASSGGSPAFHAPVSPPPPSLPPCQPGPPRCAQRDGERSLTRSRGRHQNTDLAGNKTVGDAWDGQQFFPCGRRVVCVRGQRTFGTLIAMLCSPRCPFSGGAVYRTRFAVSTVLAGFCSLGL